MTPTHVYAWGNNAKRRTLQGRRLAIVACGSRGSALVEFEGGQREIVSRRALRRIPVDAGRPHGR